jgi:hypothetical protein
LCAQDPDAACFAKTRLQIIDGTERTTKVSVNRANSIENRLMKLLEYLDAKYPGEGWGAYVDGDTPDWSSIVAAGHSQGGGHAALIARDHVLARVAMLSAPVDHVGPNQRQIDTSEPAPWLRDAHATPADRYFAFGHVSDEGSNWKLQWPALGLGLTDFGPIANVANAEPPYGGSHMLITDAQPRNNPAAANPLRNHSSIAGDALTPLTEAGQPLFAPVWQYVCFA